MIKEKLATEEKAEEPTEEEMLKVEKEIKEKVEGEIPEEIKEKIVKEKVEEKVEKEVEDAEKEIAKEITKVEDKVEGEKITQKKADKEIKKEVKEVVKEVSKDVKEIKNGTGFRKRERLSPEEREKRETEKRLEEWKPKTKLGKAVKEGKMKDVDKALQHKILEQEIIDSLLNLRSDLLAIGQAKGKFGGGKRRAWRQTQKKTAEGNVPTFACMVVVGDGKGYVGIGHGKAKETLPARAKALRNAKLNMIKVNRGCGSFDCLCHEKHSIPFKVEGKCGSSKIVLLPAPQGTGLVVGDEVKKILKLAGIKDVYSKTFGQTKTTFNLAKATINALKKLGEKK
jgi:small subunit ribosomal protein S5